MNRDVTVLIPTYARVRWLEAAIWSAVMQDHSGLVQVLVLNDCERQELRSSHPRVRVLNRSRFATLGEKRNALLHHATTEWVTFLDDDDFLLPWHCERLGAISEERRTLVNSVMSSSHIFAQGAVLTRKEGPVPIDVVTRVKGLRFDALDVGEDQRFRNGLAEHSCVETVAHPSYVYCWSNGVFHISGDSTAQAGERFRAVAITRMNEGAEQQGVIQLSLHKPILFDDAVELARTTKGAIP